MKKSTLLLSLLICALTLTGADLKFSIRQRSSTCRYQVAETVSFDILLNDAQGKPVSGKPIHYRITGDGGLKKSGKAVSAAQPVTVTASISQPGFIRLEAFCPGIKGVKMDSGAAVEPEKIRPAAERPADFDEFWAKERAAIARLAANQKVSKNLSSRYPEFAKTCDLYEIRLDDGVLPVCGVLAMPKNAEKGRHAIIMMFNGASQIGCLDAKSALNQARSYKAIVFLMNLHDTINFPSRPEVLALRKTPAVFRYQYRDADQAEKYGAGHVFRRVLRAKHWVKTLPEWDGKTLIVRGGSMGGAQSLVAAADDPDVKLCVAGAPAMCNHLGWTKKQFNGWPNLFSDRDYKTGKKRESAMKVMPYFDIVNFTPKVTCPVIMSAGYIDYICPPGSIWAAYNVIGSKNKVFHQVPMGNHGLNFDPSPKRVPGVFGYGGNEVARIAREAYKQSAAKKSK